jgi:hypothetical protein
MTCTSGSKMTPSPSRRRGLVDVTARVLSCNRIRLRDQEFVVNHWPEPPAHPTAKLFIHARDQPGLVPAQTQPLQKKRKSFLAATGLECVRQLANEVLARLRWAASLHSMRDAGAPKGTSVRSVVQNADFSELKESRPLKSHLPRAESSGLFSPYLCAIRFTAVKNGLSLLPALPLLPPT